MYRNWRWFIVNDRLSPLDAYLKWKALGWEIARTARLIAPRHLFKKLEKKDHRVSGKQISHKSYKFITKFLIKFLSKLMAKVIIFLLFKLAPSFNWPFIWTGYFTEWDLNWSFTVSKNWVGMRRQNFNSQII